MKKNIPIFKTMLLAIAMITSGATLQAQNIILSENFSSITTGDNTTTSGSGTVWTGENTNFPTFTSAYMAGGAIKLGTASFVGSLTSKNLNLSVNGGVFKVKFKVKGWSTVEGNIKITVTDLPAQTVSYTAIYSSPFEQKELTFEGGTANATVKIETTAKRAFIDDVVIYYENDTTPMLTITPQSLNAFTYKYGAGTPSAQQNFTVSGVNLTNEVTITAPSNYQISTTAGADFVPTNAIILPITGGVLTSTIIYVQLKAGLAASNYNENIAITSPGTTSKEVACNGNVACVPSGLSFATSTMNRWVGNSTFTQVATSLSAAPITYSSNLPAYATVNASTGEVTILSSGVTTISATQAASSQYCATTATYTLNISASEPTLAIKEINTSQMATEIGSTDAETIMAAGLNLTSDINLEITGANANQFSLSTSTIAQTTGKAPNTVVTITYKPTENATHKATLTLWGGTAPSLTYVLNGTATYAALNTPVATAATNKTANKFTANWDIVTGAKSYDLDVFTKSAGTETTTDLFISEYVEGLNNNKAIEIFNGTGISVNLADYSLKKQLNAAGNYTTETVFSGTLANNDVYVLANTAANATILAVADVKNSTTASFNGNDAIALFKNGVKIDEVGIFNQSTNWGADVTFIRKPAIISPKETYDAKEWETKATDYIADLGKHTISATTPSKTSISGFPMTNITDNFKTVTGLTPNTKYYYSITAKNPNVTSIASNEIMVTTANATGLENATMNLSVSTINGQIIINATAGETVNIYNTIGQQLISKPAIEGINTIAVNVKGVVIIKVGNRVAKVIL